MIIRFFSTQNSQQQVSSQPSIFITIIKLCCFWSWLQASSFLIYLFGYQENCWKFIWISYFSVSIFVLFALWERICKLIGGFCYLQMGCFSFKLGIVCVVASWNKLVLLYFKTIFNHLSGVLSNTLAFGLLWKIGRNYRMLRLAIILW